MRFSTVLLIVAIIISIGDCVTLVLGHYEYSKNYESYWDLSVKASSIPKKIEQLDKFVYALENAGLNGRYNAIMLQTPSNSFDENLAALKSLQLRLHEIQNMDVNSFQYQTALAQITQQEQNEAQSMLSVFSGVWWIENHIFLWGWIGLMNIVFFGLSFFITLFFTLED